MFSIELKTTSTIIPIFKKSRKQTVKRLFMSITAPGHIVSFLIILIFFVGGCSSSGANKTTPLNNTEELAALKKTLAQQEELLDQLQVLTTDQLLRSNEIEQSMPPRDLLESLQKGFIELQKKTLILEKQLSELKKSLETTGSKEKSSKSSSANNFSINQEKIILGLVSLQSGNPDQAVEYLQDILKAKKATTLKGDILMAIGNGFLAQGHSKQAASHYGLFLREYPKSRHTPQALYYLGQAMKDLGEVEKQKILWKELIKNYPQSSLAKRAKKRLR